MNKNTYFLNKLNDTNLKDIYASNCFKKFHPRLINDVEKISLDLVEKPDFVEKFDSIEKSDSVEKSDPVENSEVVEKSFVADHFNDFKKSLIFSD